MLAVGRGTNISVTGSIRKASRSSCVSKELWKAERIPLCFDFFYEIPNSKTLLRCIKNEETNKDLLPTICKNAGQTRGFLFVWVGGVFCFVLFFCRLSH